MGSFFQRKPVRYFLTAFKWCRITVLFLVLLVVAALTYLQMIGLPDYLKNPLLRALRQRGFEAQFASARFAWGPSIIIENATFSPTNQATGPRLSTGWTQLDLDAAALCHGRLQVDAFEVSKAGLRLPVSLANQQPLSLTDVNLHVTLLSNNLARLTDGSAWSRGIRIQMNGEIRDFLSMRDWKLFQPAPPPAPAAGHAQPAESSARLRTWEILQTIRFTGTPVLKIHFYTDGRDRNTLRAELEFTAAGTQSPWGQCGPLYLRGACARLLNSGQSPFFQARFLVHDLTTPWGAGRDLSASIDFSRDAGTNFSASLNLDGKEFTRAWNSSSGSNWVRVANLQWNGAFTLPSPSFRPDAATGTLNVTQTESGWGSIEAASLVLQARRAKALSPADPAWGQWNEIKPFALDWQANATNILTPKLKLDRVAVEGGWHSPKLTVNKLEAVMYRGRLNSGGVLDVASREVQAHATVDFDPHQISPLLTGPAQHWMSLYDWETPPKLAAGLRLVLPPWTNRNDVWPEDSRQSIQLAGDFSVGRGAFRGLAVSSAQSHFSYTNRVWNLSGLRVAVASGSLDLDYVWSELTDAYHFKFDSKIDPAIALPLLTAPQQRSLREISFSDKPEIQGDVWGDWRDAGTTGFAATLATGHFLVRGETVDQLNAKVDFTNRFLRLSQLSLLHDTGRVDVPLAGIDFASNSVVISITNGTSTLDPEPVRRALGKYAPPFMQEIHFASPPLVKASGSFIPGDDSGTAMSFFVQGDRFHWNNLTADSIQGAVDYHVRTVIVTNVQAGLYQTGKVHGWLSIEWERDGTRFSSDFNLNDLNLSALAQDLTSKSNRLEGMLDGKLVLGAPFDASDTNLFGHGWLHLHNGLLWDIKLFGAFSPLLNAIAPGSGDSRAREASASFVITNGVLSTDDLDIRSSGFRLLYRGTIDSKKRLNARVEANLLRDTPLFGHLLSWMLTPVDKIFEYRVTGTLNKPVTKPLFIPKPFLALLRPFHSLRELLPPPSPPKSNSAPTSSPAASPAKPPDNSK
jgi:hypothetical protein